LRVLIVKLSSLGDVVHTLPAVMDLWHSVPGVQIDWVVERGFAPLVQACAAVQRVIPCELRRWRHAPLAAQTRREWAAFKSELQANAYDAVIDLQGLSKSALVSFMTRLTPTGRRHAMARRTEGSGYEAPTRWVADVTHEQPWHSHACERGRLLVAQVMGYDVPASIDFGLRIVPAPLATPADLTAPDVSVQPGTVALVHGTSRDDKLWPVDHWVSLGQRLLAQGRSVALLHGSQAELQRSQVLAQALPGAVVWPRLSLDRMLLPLSQCAGVIGVDSGPSHVAVALNLPHVQLYNFDTAWRTGPPKVPHQRAVFDQPCPSVDAVWSAWQACVGAAS
jgi:heptosyltransferase-1